MSASCSDGYLCLRGGLWVPIAPVVLLLDLERRGFQVELKDDDQVSVRPFSKLTDDDKASLRRWRRHVRALLAYQPPPPAWSADQTARLEPGGLHEESHHHAHARVPDVAADVTAIEDISSMRPIYDKT
jgi:hypothetical protein